MPYRLGRFSFGLSYEFRGQAYSRTGQRESICRPVHSVLTPTKTTLRTTDRYKVLNLTMVNYDAWDQVSDCNVSDVLSFKDHMFISFAV